jgi:Domain of unknown function (DUF4834)
METASFNGFLKTLFYIVAFYYIFKFLAKLFLPHLIKKVVEKAGENFEKQQQNYQNTQQNTSNPKDVIFDKTTSDKPREKKKVGEYVDYEEIE